MVYIFILNKRIKSIFKGIHKASFCRYSIKNAACLVERAALVA